MAPDALKNNPWSPVKAESDDPLASAMMLQIAPLDMDRAAAMAYLDRFAEAGDRRRIAVAARGVGDRACRGRR